MNYRRGVILGGRLFVLQYLWHKSNYKMMKGKWKIGILLEAGYRTASDVTDLGQCIKLAERIYFQSMDLPYPQSQPLSDREQECFCEGLKMISKYIYPTISIPENTSLLIALRCIQFSVCDIQEEAFTAAAIQWASEVFQFPMPNIEVYFDPERTEDGWYGKYVYDFSAV